MLGRYLYRDHFESRVAPPDVGGGWSAQRENSVVGRGSLAADGGCRALARDERIWRRDLLLAVPLIDVIERASLYGMLENRESEEREEGEDRVESKGEGQGKERRRQRGETERKSRGY
ncbi:hypothetical protein Tco_0658545 [Tanacetum coccineum]